MTRSILLLAVGALTAVGACVEGPPEPISGVQIEVDTLGGAVRVHNSGVAPEWRLEPVLRLGTQQGGPEEFGRIRSLITDGDGNIYVADNLAQTIRVFSEDGRHIRDMGRRGQGPGEFADLYSLAWLGQALAAMDPGNARISIISRDGEPLETIRYFPITGPASFIRLHPLGTEGFYAPVIDSGRQRLPWVRFTPAGARDTIASPLPPAEARATTAVCPRPDDGITFISLPESPQVVFGFPPSGGAVAVGWSDEYRLVFLTPSGDTVRAVSRERTRPAYPDSLWDEGMRPYQELREMFPGVQCDPAVPERPRYRAALRHMLFDDAGRLWVEAAVEGGFTWEVFDADGGLLGAAAAPPRVPGIPPYVRNGTLYQVEVDELDVQHVAVYRLIEES